MTFCSVTTERGRRDRIYTVMSNQSPLLLRKIRFLEDVDGHLNIYWTEIPSIAERMKVDLAWIYIGCEALDSCTHFFIKPL